MKKYVFFFALLIVLGSLGTWKTKDFHVTGKPRETLGKTVSYRQIKSNVKKGESFYDIFKKNDLDIEELFELKQASEHIHKLTDISVGNPYSFILDEEERIAEFTYGIDNEACLSVTRTEKGFCAKKNSVTDERWELSLGGIIQDNLIASLGDDGQSIKLALKLSDIFSWDIDFASDLRKGDTFKIIAEGLYSEGTFVKYGEILFAEFTNNGNTYRAYRFEYDGQADYYDENGKLLRKSFLKAPLSFRRVSSRFAMKRFHPVLKTYRAHHGVDYAAQTGTPVVSVSEGTVAFSGYRGQYGKLVIIRHTNQYSTYYGHLSKISKGIRKGTKVEQGDVVGYVGSTGLATGPHLHYEMRIAGKPINPMTMTMSAGQRVPKRFWTRFKAVVLQGDSRFARIEPLPVASLKNSKAISGFSSPGT